MLTLPSIDDCDDDDDERIRIVNAVGEVGGRGNAIKRRLGEGEREKKKK